MKRDRLNLQWWVWLLILAFLDSLMESPAGKEYISKKEQVVGKGVFKVIKGDTDPLSGFQQLHEELEKLYNSALVHSKEREKFGVVER